MEIDILSSLPTIAVAAVFFIGSFILGYWLHWFLNSSLLNSRLEKLENLSTFHEDSIVKFENRINTSFIEAENRHDEYNSRLIDSQRKVSVVFSELEKYCVSIEAEGRALRRKHENLALEHMKNHAPLKKSVELNSKSLQAIIKSVEESDKLNTLRHNEIDGKIEKIDLSAFAKIDDLNGLLKRTDLVKYASRDDLDDFYIKSERAIYSLKNEVTSILKSQELRDTLSKSDLNEYVSKANMEGYINEVTSIKTKLNQIDLLKINKSEALLKDDLIELNSEISKVKFEFDEQKKRIDEVELRFNDEETSKVSNLFSVDKEVLDDDEMINKLSIKDIDINSKRRDDLQLIKGIGPYIETEINALGIFTFVQIASLSADDIDLITEALQIFPGRIKRDKWILQAKQLDKKAA